jgi:hypothetical protein
MRIVILLTISWLSWLSLQSQNFLHPTQGEETHQLAKGFYVYYDSGGEVDGEEGKYSPNESGRINFCAAAPTHVVKVAFFEVAMEVNSQSGECPDFITVEGDVNGRDGDYCGATSGTPTSPFNPLTPRLVFTSEPGGCLSFTFTSDDSFQGDGWMAIVDVRELRPCDCGFDCGQVIICDNFETYVAGGSLTEQSEHWVLPQGLVNDPLVVEFVPGMSLAAQFSDMTTQAALPLGNRLSGRYRLSWTITPNAGGQYQLFHHDDLMPSAFEVGFNGGEGRLFIPSQANPAEADFPYANNAPNRFTHIIDLGVDSIELWVNGTFVHKWKFSQGVAPGASLLGAVVFTGVFLLDEVCFSTIDCDGVECLEGSVPCTVTVNGEPFNSQCQACCAGYTAEEWQMQSDTPRITDFSSERSWTDREGIFLDMTLDSILYVDALLLDDLVFDEDDVVLSNYCPAGLRVEVEDGREEAVGSPPCFMFEVSWRVFIGEQQVDSLILPVQVECSIFPEVFALVYLPTADTIFPGDTLRLINCTYSTDQDDFLLLVEACDGDIQVDAVKVDSFWIGELDAAERAGEPACYREHWRIAFNQCAFTSEAVSFYFEILDDMPPTLEGPDEFTVACLKEIEGALDSVFMVGDSCGIWELSFEDDLSLFDGCTGTIVRTWTARDSCDNVAVKTQAIIVRDTIAPTFTVPDSIAIEGMAQLNNLTLTGMPTDVFDNCGIRDTSYVDAFEENVSCARRVFRTWMISDSCGNVGRGVQIITVIDVDPPTFSPPPAVTIDCLEDLDNLDITGMVLDAADNVGVQEIFYVDNLDSLDICEGFILRTWVARDSCGNQATATQRIMVDDDSPPTFAAPPQITIDCLDDKDNLELTGTVIFAADNCGVLDTAYTDVITQISDCLYQIERTWRLRDRCGNIATRVQIIRVADTQGPSFSAPPAARVSVEQIDDLSMTGMVDNATDNCAIVDTSYSDFIFREATCAEEGWIIRTWLLTDWCGNSSRATQDIFYTLPLPIADAGEPDTITCLNVTVALRGTGSSQGPKFAFEWQSDDGGFVSGRNSLNPVVDRPGMYTLVVTDTTTGCTASDTVRIAQRNDLDPNLVLKTDVNCSGDSTGALAISPQGGLAPYFIRWSNGSRRDTLLNLPVGTYTVTVTDDGICEATLTVEILQPDSLRAETTLLRAASCDESALGQARASGQGGVAPYNYTWSNGDDTAEVGGLRAGRYLVTVTDSLGCVAFDTLVMPEARPAVNLTPFPSQCENGAPFALRGGLPTGGRYFGEGVVDGLFDPAAAGVGEYRIGYAFTAANGCADTAFQTMSVFMLPQLIDSTLAPICINSDPVRLEFIRPIGGNYTGRGVSSGSTFTPSVAGVGSHPVLYSYRDPETGCFNSMATIITVVAAIEASFEAIPSETMLCAGDTLEVEINANNAGAAARYEWRVNGALQSVPNGNFSLTLPPGRFDFEGVMISSLACLSKASDTVRFSVRVDTAAAVSILYTDTTLCYNIDSLELPAGNPRGGVWSGDGVLGNVFYPGRVGPGVYELTYTYRGLNDCEGQATLRLEIEVCTPVFSLRRDIDMRVYPNPAESFFFLELSGVEEEAFLRVTDISGRPVLQQTLNPHGTRWTRSVDISNWPKGVYLLQVNAGARLGWERIIVP